MNSEDKNRKIKILYFIGSLQLGGAERQLAELATRLDKTRFDVEICCIAQGGPLVKFVEHHGVPVRIFNFYLVRGKLNPYSYFHLIRELWRIYRYIKKSRPDIVHAFLYTAYIVGIACARVAGVPVTIASRRSLGYFKDNTLFKQPLENIINKFTNYVLVNSEAVKQDVLRREKIDPQKIHLIYNGVDIQRFQHPANAGDIRTKLGIPDDCVTIGVVANLIPYKGHTELIESARIIKNEFPQTRFVCVGRDSGIKPKLESLIHNYHLEEMFIFTGDRTDIPELMQAFDIVALASYEEGFSNVILEAMASGKPVVATNVGGNPEAVVHGKTGLIVPPRSPQALADALLRLLKDPQLRSTLGKNGLERARKLFSIEHLIENMQNFYLSAMKKRNN
ncbi:glycosyltransferase [Candidatus Sumerlaeota bacterium]|nr:glycosyltransferase [Candidatus Sumerlaeota bacterium]